MKMPVFITIIDPFILYKLRSIAAQQKYKATKVQKNKKQMQQGKRKAPLSTTRTHFYTNCIFMGQAKSLQKIGPALLLFHDNTCAIVTYNNNSQFDGRSVFYRNRCIISVNWIRNRIKDVAYRVDGYMIYLKYDDQARLHGEGFLIDFIDRTVFQLRYEEGNFKSKSKLIIVEKLTVQNFFLTESYHLLIGKSHSRVLRHQLTQQQIPSIRMIKVGNKIQVNYMENINERLAQGLGFQMIFRVPEKGGYNPETNQFKDDFQLKLVEKGMYKDNMLQGYGMRIFKNNNIYQGYFIHNVFHKEGCLQNSLKGSWVYGIFQTGQMKEIIDFNNQGNQIAKCKVLLDELRRSSNNFINSMVEENNFDFLDAELERVCSQGDIQLLKNQAFEDKKQDLMRRITAQFTQLQAVNNQTLNEQAKKLQNNKLFMKATVKKQERSYNPNGGNQTQRKQRKPYSIKSLLPQSARISNIPMYVSNNRNKRESEQEKIDHDRDKFERILQMNKSVKDPAKQYSRIFHKTYSNLYEEDAKKDNSTSPQKRMRKSQIFTSEAFAKTQNSWNATRSPHGKGGASPSQEVYKGRSPQRLTSIFPNSVKLKKIKKSESPTNFQLEDNNAIKSGKSSVQKKMFGKSKGKKGTSNQIFEDEKQKQIESGQRFTYTYQNMQERDDQKSGQLTPIRIHNKLQPPTLMRSTRL